ncbi:hypothetical protein EMCRGX_G013960 [Ephydatia muelleri]
MLAVPLLSLLVLTSLTGLGDRPKYCTCENLSGLLQNTFAVGVSGLLQLECFSPSFKPRIGKIIRGSKVTWSSIDNNKMHQMAFWRRKKQFSSGYKQMKLSVLYPIKQKTLHKKSCQYYVH